MGQLKGKIDIRGKLVQWGGFKLTDKERKGLKEFEIGVCVNALTDPEVTQEDIRDARIDSLLGKGLQDFAIDYKKTGAVGQTLTGLQAEIGKKADETSVAARFDNTATKSFVNEAVGLKANKAELDALAATVDTKADKADIIDPEWGAITGTLTDQQDLKNALSSKAGIDYVTDAVAQKVDTITFNAFKSNTPTITYVNTKMDEKADNSSVLSLSSTVDNLRTEVSGKASTSYVDTQVATRASTTAVNNLSSRVDNLSTQVLSKVGTALYEVEVTSSGWTTTVPYTKSIEVEGIRSTDRLLVGLSMQNVTVATLGAKKEAYACISKITPVFNALEIKCYDEKPVESFSIKVLSLV